MTEKELAEDYKMVLNEAKSMGCNKIKALYNIPLESMELIVQALEKQIPKKVVDKEKVTTSEGAEAYGADALFGECPVCKLTQSSVWNDEFCGDCGQRLDWSDDNG